jgi:hypothetical protein
MKKKYAGYKTPAQAKALKSRKTSFGIIFTRSKTIEEVFHNDGSYSKARFAGKLKVPSLRRFISKEEATAHAKRFKRIEKHKSFEIVLVKKAPNAWVNVKTGKTNPVIGRKRTNRR